MHPIVHGAGGGQGHEGLDVQVVGDQLYALEERDDGGAADAHHRAYHTLASPCRLLSSTASSLREHKQNQVTLDIFLLCTATKTKGRDVTRGRQPRQR